MMLMLLVTLMTQDDARNDARNGSRRLFLSVKSEKGDAMTQEWRFETFQHARAHAHAYMHACAHGGLFGNTPFCVIASPVAACLSVKPG